MYNIIGADGKEYGPISIEQIRQWIADGRINAHTRMQVAGSAEWKTTAEFSELGLTSAAGLSGPGSAPPLRRGGQAEGPQKGLAITSFVLGLDRKSVVSGK